jgi:uncharacterized protein YneF (UPF0154 family)
VVSKIATLYRFSKKLHGVKQSYAQYVLPVEGRYLSLIPNVIFGLTTAIYKFITPSLSSNPTISHHRYKIMTTRIRQSISDRKIDVIMIFQPSKPNLAPTRLPIPGVVGEPSRWLKRPEHEADHEPPCNVEVKDEWNYICTTPVAR